MINYTHNIQKSNLSIYDPIDEKDVNLFIPTQELQKILEKSLIGLSLKDLPLRTRSKKVKTEICNALGYPVPTSFKRSRPRFLGQNFDVYTQKSMNVQIWNEDVDGNRRYVFLRTSEDDIIDSVKIISGDELVQYDRTGKLTQKYQARMKSYDEDICSSDDTVLVQNWRDKNTKDLLDVNVASFPQKNELLGIRKIYELLAPLVGKDMPILGAIQERNRGAYLQDLICSRLGYCHSTDDGKYPDLKNQLLEVKLQTSPTIDLGLHSPEDGEKVFSSEGVTFTSKDVRYAIFDGLVQGESVVLRRLYLVTGEELPKYFPLFEGMKTNKKIQIPLPRDFFTQH